jgi:23S rRNA (guanosine2251-2'-O)-methyltransferase
MVEKRKMDKKDFVFGIRAVIEAIHSDKEIDRVLIKKGLKGELIQELTELTTKLNIPVQYVPVEKINRVTRKIHQGVVAFISPIVYYNIEEILPALYEEGKNPLILVLDRVSDVRNFGAIARSAEVAGVHAIIIPDRGAAQINADAIKTSAGALHIIPVCRVRSLEHTVRFLKDSGLIINAASEKGDKLYYESDMSSPLAIVMGAEDKGIDISLLKNVDQLVKIPLQGEIGSLNVSVAASILMFDAVRQRSIQ